MVFRHGQYIDIRLVDQYIVRGSLPLVLSGSAPPNSTTDTFASTLPKAEVAPFTLSRSSSVGLFTTCQARPLP